MNNLECLVCLSKYNSVDKRPACLPCGHSVCRECLEDLIQGLCCPLCCEAFPEVVSTSQLKDNWYLLETLEFYEVRCFNHKERLAKHFSVQKTSAFCETCAEREDLDLEEIDLGTHLTNSSLDLIIENPDKVTPKLRAKFREIHTKPNQEKIKLFKELNEIVSGLKCEVHTNQSAQFLNPEEAKLSCDMCENTTGYLSIFEEATKQELTRSIQNYAYEMHYAYFSTEEKVVLKNVHNYSTEFLVKLFKQLLCIDKKDSSEFLSAVCINCSNEFTRDNLPMVLACPGTHMICLACAKFETKCPLDSRSFSLEELTPWNTKTYTVKCQGCGDWMDTLKKLPLVTACGRTLCEVCFNMKFKALCLCKVFHKSPSHKSEFLCDIFEKNQLSCLNHPVNLAFYLDTETLKCYCNQCSQGKLNLFSFLNEDLEDFLVTECLRTGACQNSISKLKNSQKLEMLLRKPVLPAPVVQRAAQVKGSFIPETQAEGFEAITRFRTVLPGEASTGKPWVINKHQIEAVVFEVNRPIQLTGIGIATPLRTRGVLEYLNITASGSTQKLLENQILEGSIIKDFVFEKPLVVDPCREHLIVFKISADKLYKGNPMDRVQVGSDGTIFEFKHPNLENTNGRLDVSGPLLRMLYSL